MPRSSGKELAVAWAAAVAKVWAGADDMAWAALVWVNVVIEVAAAAGWAALAGEYVDLNARPLGDRIGGGRVEVRQMALVAGVWAPALIAGWASTEDKAWAAAA